MQDKKKKTQKTKEETRVRDLKPKKDAKGGGPHQQQGPVGGLPTGHGPSPLGSHQQQ